MFLFFPKTPIKFWFDFWGTVEMFYFFPKHRSNFGSVVVVDELAGKSEIDPKILIDCQTNTKKVSISNQFTSIANPFICKAKQVSKLIVFSRSVTIYDSRAPFFHSFSLRILQYFQLGRKKNILKLQAAVLPSYEFPFTLPTVLCTLAEPRAEKKNQFQKVFP